jgi:hypothetical protein
MGRMSELHAYITESLKLFPGIPKNQLVAMVILHFDIPDADAAKFVDQVITSKDNGGIK